MSINTEEVNFLVYRYLEEAGFHHSAYLFGYESSVITAGIDGTLIPRGALLSLLQKSVLFAEAEVFSLLTESEIDAKFEKAIGSMSLLECTTTDAAKLKAMEKVKEDLSHVCSPHPSTSTNTTTTTASSTVTASNVPKKTTSENVTDAILNVEPAVTVPLDVQESNTTDTTSTSSVSARLTADNTSTSSANGTVAEESYLSNNTSTSYYTLTSTTSSTYTGNNVRSPQMQRERDFRAQQSQSVLTAASLPRSSYRTTASNDGKCSNVVSSSSNNNTTSSQHYYQHRQSSSGDTGNCADVTTASSLQFLNSPNGLPTSLSLMQHHQQQSQQPSTALNKEDFSSSKIPQPPSRYLLNGNHAIRKGQSAGPTSAVVSSVAGSTTNSGKSSVLTAPTGMFHYFKENQ